MKSGSILIIGASVALAACTSYVIPAPSGFAPATTLPVAGASGFRQKDMTIGEYQVAINRGSTREGAAGTDLVSDRDKRQSYNFVIRRASNIVFTGGCILRARETSVNAPAGVKITASEKAELECEMLPQGSGRDSWRLELSGDPDNPLNGSLAGAGSAYTIQGIGTAFGSTKYGPTGGYYIKQNDRTVATAQVTGKRQVLFAEGAQSDALLAATVVLLLIDESVRDLDD